MNRVQNWGADLMSTADRRAALRATLIDLARETIAESGLRALKARDLAKSAGCSVGAIYNVFGDLNDLAMAVNGETFKALGAHVLQGLEPHAAAAPVDRLIAMSEAYLDFASQNPRLWRALFDISVTRSAAPEWYLQALDNLFAIIDAPIAEVFPDLSQPAVRIRTRALFSSVHGIVLLGIEARISGVGEDDMPEMIRFVLRSIVT